MKLAMCVLLACCLMLANTDSSAQTAPAAAAWLAPCSPAGVVGAALCGEYAVWEDRAARRGRRIELRVLVLPARGNARLPDPLFYLAGGPGQSAVNEAANIANLLTAVWQQRDLVFVDLRGTGESGALLCENPTQDAPLQAWFGEFLPDAFVRKCLARQSADVRLYANPPAVDDLDEVRAALGYTRINLFGISGGTRTAQVYLRRHPGSVRSLVLKGVVPMDMENPLPHARNLETSMKALVEACATEAACRTAFPDLARDWERSKQRFEAGAVEAAVTHPVTGKSGRVHFDRGAYADGVRHVLYSVRASRGLPAMVHAAAGGNFDVFAQRELQQAIDFGDIADGVFLSTTCAEDVRYISEEDVRRATEGTFMGDYRVRRQQAACAIWPSADLGGDFQEAVRSAVPALLLSGAHDAVTSPEGAERVARAMSRSHHVVFPNQSHDFANLRCEQQLIADFIAGGSAERLDATCVAATRRPPFVVPESGRSAP
jgi:pimeloyl-ACP methyl ester carboxylesterase